MNEPKLLMGGGLPESEPSAWTIPACFRFRWYSPLKLSLPPSLCVLQNGAAHSGDSPKAGNILTSPTKSFGIGVQVFNSFGLQALAL